MKHYFVRAYRKGHNFDVKNVLCATLAQLDIKNALMDEESVQRLTKLLQDYVKEYFVNTNVNARITWKKSDLLGFYELDYREFVDNEQTFQGYVAMAYPVESVMDLGFYAEDDDLTYIHLDDETFNKAIKKGKRL